MFSSVAATTMSRSALSRAVFFGLTTNSPSILATRTSEIGPLNGISDIEIAVDAASAAKLSGDT